MTRTRRLLAGAAALAVTVIAAGCDTSPYAAVVNSQSIKQTALNAELRARGANHAYIVAVDQQGQANQFSVEGVAPGTYSTKWTAEVLDELVAATSIHQTLAAQGKAPDAALLDATRAFDASGYGALWLGFSPQFRTTLVERDAEHSLIEAVNADQTALYNAYHTNQKYYFTSVCVRQIAVSVPNSDGTIDDPASAGLAANIANQYNITQQVPALAGTLGEVTGGAVICYSQADLETQPATFYNTVLGLGVGHAAPPDKTVSGYRVVAVVSRVEQGFSFEVQRVVSLGLDQSDPAVVALIAGARVKINPQYGSWSKGSATSAPQVVPPTLSATT